MSWDQFWKDILCCISPMVHWPQTFMKFIIVIMCNCSSHNDGNKDIQTAQGTGQNPYKEN